jgi:hypothetical protein
MATIIIATRPSTLDGCFQTWSEHDAPAIIRSEMDLGGFVKVRRRVSRAAWQVEASVTLPASLYNDFVNVWWRTNCAHGIYPTRVKRPDGVEVVMRFTQAPVVSFPESNKDVFSATVTLEQLPAWVNL